MKLEILEMNEKSQSRYQPIFDNSSEIPISLCSAEHIKKCIYTLQRTQQYKAFVLKHLEGSTMFIERVKNSFV